MEEKTLAKSYVYEGNVVNLREDKAQIDDGQIVERVVVEHPGGVGIALEDEDGKFFFVKQYRYAQSEVTLEYPAGKREAGETKRTGVSGSVAGGLYRGQNGEYGQVRFPGQNEP